MSKFVEECRREWRRLRVPEAVANEMAADLAADLEEAEAEGASAEEVLGSGAFDPSSFAAAWAAGRGVIPPLPVERGQFSSRPSRLLAAIAIFALIAIVGALLAVRVSSSTRAVRVAFPFRPADGLVVPRGGSARLRLDPGRIVQPGPAGGFAVVGNSSGSDLHGLGSVLVVVGLVGLILSIGYWLLSDQPSQWTRRRARVRGPGYYS